MPIKRRFRRVGFHLLCRLAGYAARNGFAGLRRHGYRLGQWHYRLNWTRRRQLIGQMGTALGRAPQDPTLASDLAEAYRVNDRAILEILAMYTGAVDADQVAQACRVEGLEHLDQALSGGQGVILLGMHMGNGVAMAVHLARLGYPVDVIYREAGKIPVHFFRDGIRSLGLEAIPAEPATVGFRRMLKALRSNRILFILMDQASKKGGVPTRFLGKELHMPPGPAELARRTGAGVIPVQLTEVEPQWVFRLQPSLGLDRADSLEHDVDFLTQIMQSQIIDDPQWWTWHQRRWWRYPFANQPSSSTGE